jgi:hypothetical protein
LTLPDEIFDSIVSRIGDEKGPGLAAYQPKFLVDQVVATCKFMGQPPHFEARFIDYAIDNLRVRRSSPGRTAALTIARSAA